MAAPFSELRKRAREAAKRAHAPFSGLHEGALLVLADGTWVPGVRVESATYSLLISPLLNAFTTAVAAGRMDVIAAIASDPFRDEDVVFFQQALDTSLHRPAPDVLVRSDLEGELSSGPVLDPLLTGPPPATPAAGIEQAREVAERAYVPASNYHVGCVLVGTEGELVPGVNVEHPDWSRILCAERNAISTAVTYSIEPRTLYLSCLDDPEGTPCGACRQILVELAPKAEIWIDRGSAPPEQTTSQALLPGAFRGHTLSLS